IAGNMSELSANRLKMAGLSLSESEKTLLSEYAERIEDPSKTMTDTEEASRRLYAADARKNNLSGKERLLGDLRFELDETVNKKRKTGTFAGLGTVLLILGGALLAIYFLVSQTLSLLLSGGALCFLGILCFVLFGIRSSILNQEIAMQNSRIDKTVSEADILTEEIAGAEDCASEILTNCGILYNESTAVSDLKKLYSDCYDYMNLLKKQELFKANDRTPECEALSTEIKSLFLDFCLSPSEEDFASALSSLNRRKEACNSAENLLKDAAARKEVFEESHDLSELSASDETEYTLEDVAGMEADTDSKLKTLRESFEIYRHQLSDFTERQEELSDIKDKLDEVQQTISEKSELASVLEDTKNYLTKAKESLTARYMGPLTSGFEKYYETVTGKPATDYKIDANTEITVTGEGLQHSALLLSSGYKDLVGLCMRLAMADAMYEGEKPMLIMDDPFVNFDDRNYEGGRKLLDKASAEYQILYFSCRETGQNN
ncbi:MAG: hypothetical protein ILP13_04815, partial [Lachnospiraceae bacterium]|nr:hypothetical protein [Lachnospiraceae bacterium]